MKVVNVKMCEEEHAQLKRDAHKHEMNVSEYIRWLVENEHERKKED